MGYHFFKDEANNNYQTVVYVDGGSFPSEYQNIYCFAYPNEGYEFDHWEMVALNDSTLVAKFYPKEIEKEGEAGLNG